MSEPEEITFQRGPIRVGQIAQLTSEEETQLVFSGRRVSDGAPVRSVSTFSALRARREEILAVRGAVGARLRVTFVEDRAAQEAGGHSEEGRGPLAGLTFELERNSDEGALSVFDASGAPAAEPLAAQVAALYREFGRAHAATAKLPVGPQRIGQRSPELAEAVAAGVASGASISKVERCEATLAAIRPGPDGALHGLYELTLKVVGRSGGSVITLEQKGTMLLRDRDGAPLEVQMSGPLHSVPDPEEAPANVPAGAGEFRMRQTMEFVNA